MGQYPSVSRAEQTTSYTGGSDSEEELGYMWGDSGRLYFWIREDDCQKTRFDQTWVVLQCF
ncbi:MULTISPECIES: DUF1963 domain-containing protein [Lysinibacillus]|uniref:DUF1963 domain-containing protein n=1 Tax=Lysinibacillus TaxID=400634 RepID=UPI00210F916E|nr:MULTISPECIES: DUF1963 domain-containing protein [unclassified Lysinibacillus]MEE3806196.1 DUF1963 domain-containing protein [Lysinibacillus fusiformis]